MFFHYAIHFNHRYKFLETLPQCLRAGFAIARASQEATQLRNPSHRMACLSGGAVAGGTGQ